MRHKSKIDKIKYMDLLLFRAFLSFVFWGASTGILRDLKF